MENFPDPLKHFPKLFIMYSPLNIFLSWNLGESFIVLVFEIQFQTTVQFCDNILCICTNRQLCNLPYLCNNLQCPIQRHLQGDDVKLKWWV